MSVDATSGNSSAGAVTDTSDFGSSGSLQLQFARLQLTQSEIAKDAAEDYMTKIQDTQKQQKECAAMIEDARALQADAKNGDNCTTMPQDMVDYFKANGLEWETKGKDTLHNSDEWDYNLKSLSNHQEQLGTSAQTDMVFLNDFMGQYNSYLQGANKTITDANQTLMSIITR